MHINLKKCKRIEDSIKDEIWPYLFLAKVWNVGGARAPSAPPPSWAPVGNAYAHTLDFNSITSQPCMEVWPLYNYYYLSLHWLHDQRWIVEFDTCTLTTRCMQGRIQDVMWGGALSLWHPSLWEVSWGGGGYLMVHLVWVGQKSPTTVSALAACTARFSNIRAGLNTQLLMCSEYIKNWYASLR